jgi:adenylate kinase family enzyme
VERIAIVGCGGSGKSFVARELGRRLNVPVTHLDAVYYDGRWNPLPMEEFEARQRELVAAPRWVIDGNYNATLHVRLAAADTVIFMDLPTRTCLWGIIARRLRYGKGQRPNGVYHRISLGFLLYVLRYRRAMRPRVRAKLDRCDAQVIRLTGRRRVRRFLDDVSPG